MGVWIDPDSPALGRRTGDHGIKESSDGETGSKFLRGPLTFDFNMFSPVPMFGLFWVRGLHFVVVYAKVGGGKSLLKFCLILTRLFPKIVLAKSFCEFASSREGIFGFLCIFNAFESCLFSGPSFGPKLCWQNCFVSLRVLGRAFSVFFAFSTLLNLVCFRDQVSAQNCVGKIVL